MHVERPGRETGTCTEYIDSFLLLSEINLKKKSPLPYLHVIICPSPTLLFKLGLFVIALFFFLFWDFEAVFIWFLFAANIQGCIPLA